MTQRGPFQPLPFCDSVTLLRLNPWTDSYSASVQLTEQYACTPRHEHPVLPTSQ